TYNFESGTGNLLSRRNNKLSQTENFAYDNLNRLTDYGNNQVDYDSKGNILAMSNVGNFEYHTTGKPYAISGAEPSSAAIPLRDQRIIFNSFKQPNRISEGNYTAYYTYGVSNQRTKMRLESGSSTVLQRYYLGGCYEEDKASGTTTQRLYLDGDYYTAPAVFVKEGSANWKIYYICRDYLGSITHVLAADGSLKQELSYDAWGRLRNPSTLEIYSPGSEPTLFLGRGYTGHEHLNCFGLIHMNGRLYDPAVGRFLSPDNNIQAPDFSQNFNRYSYCLNNPLKYNDPEGEFVVAAFLIGMAISAAIDYGMQVAMNHYQGYSGKDAWLNKVDFFDVALSGTIGGLTAGWGASLKAGETVGKFGAFLVNNATYVKAGEIVATSAVDITGEGWQPVTFNQFGQRAVIGLGTMYATDLVSSKLAKKPSVSVEQKVEGARTSVLGHYPDYAELSNKLGANRFEIPLDVWNKMSPAEQWGANQKFLDRMMLRGDKIRLATPLSKVKPGSFFEKELNYLFENGYHLSTDKLWLIK
ncbi:MAG: RHS repeat domain-containing protein, partial [Mangrovibacterium sp.]